MGTEAAAPRPGSAAGFEEQAMARAIELARSVRRTTSPNPWVGCVVVGAGAEHDPGAWAEGATEPPGGRHAEVVALEAAGERARGATLAVTLEPCAHHGRTPPCVDAIRSAGIARVVFGIEDPDVHVAGAGAAVLRAAGIAVDGGVRAAEVAGQLAPYLVHRRTGRPYVVLKLAATVDARIAAPDGSSRWLTGEEARADAQALRADSDAVLVGAGTVRSDDPQLTVRIAGFEAAGGRQPLRVVLGHGEVPAGARVQPALRLAGDPGGVLDELGGRGVVQLLVEGGAHVAHAFHSLRLVDRYVIYIAPVLAGGDDGVPLMAGPGAPTVAELWRGRIVEVRRLGPDLRVDLEPSGAGR